MLVAAENARASGQISLMGFEYKRTITVGRRAQLGAEVNANAVESIPIVPVSRGGLVTLHNEGQCVIYPIVPLREYDLFAKEWIGLLTQTTRNCLDKCNIIVSSTNSGVFTPHGKIASIGIDIKRGVSTHGIAVNVSNSLEDFSLIIPCGINNQVFDRVANYGPLTAEEFFRDWSEEFKKSFAPYQRRTLTNTPANL